MSTEVIHGPHPPFTCEANLRESFWCRVEGHYTTTPGLAAAGVSLAQFQSDRPEKQMAELLALRTAFMEWFLVMYQELGGTREEALGQLTFIVDRMLNRRPEDDPQP